MLIRPPLLQFFKDVIKITVTDVFWKKHAFKEHIMLQVKFNFRLILI